MRTNRVEKRVIEKNEGVQQRRESWGCYDWKRWGRRWKSERFKETRRRREERAALHFPEAFKTSSFFFRSPGSRVCSINPHTTLGSETHRYTHILDALIHKSPPWMHKHTHRHTHTHTQSTASERWLVMKQFICKDSLSNWLTSGTSRSAGQLCVCPCVCVHADWLQF